MSSLEFKYITDSCYNILKIKMWEVGSSAIRLVANGSYLNGPEHDKVKSDIAHLCNIELQF